ncbi:MAG: type IV pilus secretin PilQ [Proteobacteria bacterium]|nr:type IV pilus secretin PilQ [Pseudomonadota bacterium]
MATFIFALFCGCNGEKRVKKDTFFDKWKVKAETSQGYSPSPKKRVVDLKKREVTATGQETAVQIEKTLPTREISLTMHNVDAAVLLRTLARAADLNILINESVKGKADVNIKKAPWDQVFNGILSSHGLTYAWVGDIIRIMTIEDREQDLKREAQKKEFKLVEPLATRIVQVDYADAKKLQGNLEKFLTMDKDNKPIGSVLVDEHTHSLIIQAIADDIKSMILLIQELDRPTFQIRIEAHIVEATRDTSKKLGIQWGGLYNLKSSGGSVDHWITPGSGITGSDIDARTSITTGNVVNFPADFGTSNLGFSLGYVAQRLGAYTLSAQLTALQKEGKVNILSSPSITTLDNQMAIIESGKEVPYFIRDDAGNTITEYKDAVLRLEVTPHVINQDTLTLQIKTQKDEVDTVTEGAIKTKKAETKVVLFDGQTTVIGGLNNEKVTNTDYGVPFLKDIPLLGYFFKGIDKKNELEDVLIFITPHILKEYVEIIDTQEVPTDQPPEPEVLPGEKMIPQDAAPGPEPLPGEKMTPQDQPPEPEALPGEKMVPQDAAPEPKPLSA